VVDLGAGTGRLTVELARRGAVVLALDLSPRSLEINRRKSAAVSGSRVHHVVCDACYLPLRDGVAGKAVSGMMLEHLPGHTERRRCLAEVYRVLRPGGRLALTVYNYCLAKRRRGDREGFHGADLYYYRFDATEFRQLLDQYRVRKVTGLLNLPRGLQSCRLDALVAALPPLAQLRGILLFGVAER
jgi:ubiquinone/menaquinone biosynthesis C-methylase UbiE